MTAKSTNLRAGTIINIAVNILRSELKDYFFLAASSILWSSLPIYGWAKSTQVCTVISVKAYQKLLGIEESTKDISHRLKRKLWSFWRLNLLGIVYIFLAIIICLVIVSIITYFLFKILDVFVSSEVTILGFFILILSYLFTSLGVINLFFWLYGRVAFAELPLALESNINVFSSIARSWDLTKGQVRKIQFVFSITSAVLSILCISIPSVLVARIATLLGGYWLVYICISSLSISLLQIIKGVIYYDLVCLKEGIDLKITP